MRFGVITFPGSNCDSDCIHVLREVLNQEVIPLWHEDKSVQGADCIILPGGFSYGDYLRSGAVARFSPIMEAIKEAAKEGRFIIGICNGFQILLEMGLLPGAMQQNRSLKFRCEWTHLRVETKNTPFTSRCSDVLKIPIAHGEGNYYCSRKQLAELEQNGQIIFRYAREDGTVDEATNPNGSVDNIAGITNKAGNILGMMPHPERASESLLGSADGRQIFESVLEMGVRV